MRQKMLTDYWSKNSFAPSKGWANKVFLVAFLILSTALLAWPAKVFAVPDHSQICEDMAALVARETGVPVTVLRAISLNETGRKMNGSFRPWPWTVNMEGKGVWFDTYAEALAYANQEFKRGARSFDVGCFQLNYKWHHQAFTSIEEMFDPTANARYAARFLLELFREKGNWTDAAGAYHSRTKEFADRYKARFDTFRAKLASETGEHIAPGSPSADIPLTVAQATIPEAPKAPRVNNFPLLIAGTEVASSLGSLVPLGASNGRLISVD